MDDLSGIVLGMYLITRAMVKLFPGKWDLKHIFNHEKRFCIKKCLKNKNIMALEILAVLNQTNG